MRELPENMFARMKRIKALIKYLLFEFNLYENKECGQLALLGHQKILKKIVSYEMEPCEIVGID